MEEEYAFLREYVESLANVADAELEGGYYLNPGADREYLNKVQLQEGIVVPDELVSLYMFTYGAKLGDYILLTLPEVASLVREMRETYKEQWLEGVLPVFYVQGVGDTIAINTREVDSRGKSLILDGFHELPPSEWKEIGFGLQNWLENMTKNRFQPFWL